VRIVCYDRAQEYRGCESYDTGMANLQVFFLAPCVILDLHSFLTFCSGKMIYAGGVLLHVERFF
jgi:hypothetical protein